MAKTKLVYKKREPKAVAKSLSKNIAKKAAVKK